MEAGLTDGGIFGKVGSDVFCGWGAEDHICIGARSKFQIGSIAPDGILPIFSWKNPKRIPDPGFGHVAVHKVIEGKGVCGDKGKSREWRLADFLLVWLGAAGELGRQKQKKNRDPGKIFFRGHTSV
jgi:hypothetical protein